MTTVNVRWKLKEALEKYQTNPYALAREMGDQNKAVTLYRLTSPTKQVSRIDLKTLGDILTALRGVTGKTVPLEDLLEIVEVEGEVTSNATLPAWQSFAGLLDDPVFITTQPGELERELGEAVSLEVEASTTGQR